VKIQGQPVLLLVTFVALLIIVANIDASRGTLQIGDPAPKLSGSVWINSPSLNSKDLDGRVVLIEFWTYG
jgi:hypothetical protein